MDWILILQVLVSVIFFANKVFILEKLKIGWLLGVIAAALAVLYFYLIGLPVYTALEGSLIILMGYGFFKGDFENPRVELVIQLVIMIVMCSLAIFAFNGRITIVELPSAVGMLWGTYFLTHHQERKGWALYGFAHVLAAVLGYQKGQTFFADFQVASAVVCCVGWAKNRNRVTTKAVTS
ncbi:MAG: hypothetical protein UX71_C0010G0018 [Parcubacteria group bacterium GW2011_GWA1_47_10]|nr:MAG: hypothetical protein UX71_C0010G0018 [Parcubacteria group bacterium GW2011_GWA1_47_10]